MHLNMVSSLWELTKGIVGRHYLHLMVKIEMYGMGYIKQGSPFIAVNVIAYGHCFEQNILWSIYVLFKTIHLYGKGLALGFKLR